MIFEISSIKNMAQFTWSLLNVTYYVQTKYNNKVEEAMRTMTKPMFTYTEVPWGSIEIEKEGNKVKSKPNELDVFMWRGLWKGMKEKEKEFNKYETMAYPLVLGQCSPALWAHLKGTKGYENIELDQDMVEILQLIRGLCCRHDHNNDETCAVVMSLKNLFYYYQKPETTNYNYLKEFEARVESADDFDACVLGKFPCLVKKKLLKMYDKTFE